MAKKPHFDVGNQVYIKTDKSHGDTLYEITKLLPGCGCLIREYTSAPPFHKEQRWDTSMLKHAVTDEMLKAFSLGSLRAGRRKTA